MSTVKLQGNDGKEPFDVDIEVACCSQIIKDMLNDLGYTEEEKNDVIPVPNVSNAILRKVMEWATYHKDDPEQTINDQNNQRRTDDISPWDAEYLQVDLKTLNDLMLAAYYLDMRGLLHLTCKAVANMIRGKTPEEIRETFNIKNDSTPAEEQPVREENELIQKN